MSADAPRAVSMPDEFLRHPTRRNTGDFPGIGRRVRDGDTVIADVRVPFWPYPARPVIRLANADCPETTLARAKGGPAEVVLGMMAKTFTAARVLYAVTRQPLEVSPSPSDEEDDNARWIAFVRVWETRTRKADLGEALELAKLTKRWVPAFAEVFAGGDAALIANWGKA